MLGQKRADIVKSFVFVLNSMHNKQNVKETTTLKIFSKFQEKLVNKKGAKLESFIVNSQSKFDANTILHKYGKFKDVATFLT